MFTPLLVHSDYSAGVGSSTVESLVERAAELGYSALALTDVDNVRGQVRFHHAAHARGLKAITGVTLRSGAKTLIVLACDRHGYSALCSMLSRRALGGHSDGWSGVDFANESLLFISDDETLNVHSLMRPGEAAKPRAVACPQLVMARGADAPVHALLCAIHGTPVGHGKVLPPLELVEDFFPRAAIDETSALADLCTLDLTSAGPMFPELPNAGLLLARKVLSVTGANPYKSTRVREELDVIERLGFSSYFLLVSQVVEAARALGIHVAARGSVVSSLVGHLLGFSPVDPLKEGLLFERFLHAARTKPPDVDLDVPSERREELIAWTLRHLGTHRAALISTHVMFRRRSAWRAGLSALGVEAAVIDLLFASMPSDPEWDAPPPVTGPLAEHAPAIEALIGRFHHTSIHPGGVALAAEHLEDVTPLEAPRVTQLDAQALEALGVLKLDLLGSRALSVIDESIRRAGGIEPSAERDAATLEALRNADTLGCAHVESPPMRATLLSLPLQSKEELTSALALVRRGPSAGRGLAEDEPIYDEDLIKLISATTRLPLDEADELRARVIRGEPVNFLELGRAAGTPARQLQRAWRVVQHFSAYSFSKAHAASTAAQAWTSVQLKHRHPAAFACAALNHSGGAYPLRTLLADFQRHGVDFLKPSVNASLPSSSLEGDVVRLGLSLVKHLSTATLKRILAKRPFSTFEDFLAVSPARAELEALVMSGACDDLAPLRPELFPLAHHEVLSLVADGRPLSELVPRRVDGASGARWRALQRIKHELLFLDVHVTAHPLGVLREDAARIGCIPIAELARRNGWRARFAGLIAASRRHRTERGKLMQFVTFEDETGLVESRLRLDARHDALSSPGPWLLDGLVQLQQRAVIVELTGARPFHQRPR